MSEIEKMYRNSGIKKIELDYPDNFEPFYPEFTAEKQIELIKWLAFRDYISIVAYIGGEYHSEHDKYNADENSLENCLARLVNTLWQDLTEEERKQIKEILK